jgi:hypothetical protein
MSEDIAKRKTEQRGVLTNPVFRPEFIRLPKPGTLCPCSGLARTALYILCAEGKVESKVIRQRGATRGIRLIVYDSLMRYLHSLESGSIKPCESAEREEQV